MQITTDIILQNFFLASIILIALSLPKMILLIIWSRLCIYAYEKGTIKLADSKKFGGYLRQMFPNFLINGLRDEKTQFKYITDTVMNVNSQLKIPLIEAFSSAVLMVICLIYLDFDATSFWIIVSLIVILIIVSISTLILAKKFFNRIKPFFNKYPPKKEKNPPAQQEYFQ